MDDPKMYKVQWESLLRVARARKLPGTPGSPVVAGDSLPGLDGGTVVTGPARAIGYPGRNQAASSPSANLMGTSTPSAKRAARTSSPFIASMNFRSVPT
jgi:hypothetical protein